MPKKFVDTYVCVSVLTSYQIEGAYCKQNLLKVFLIHVMFCVPVKLST